VVLYTAYDAQWTASVSGRELPHFLVNGFANGFLLSGKGATHVTIFKGDQYLQLGAPISALTLIITASSISIETIKTKLRLKFKLRCRLFGVSSKRDNFISHAIRPHLALKGETLAEFRGTRNKEKASAYG